MTSSATDVIKVQSRLLANTVHSFNFIDPKKDNSFATYPVQLKTHRQFDIQYVKGRD